MAKSTQPDPIVYREDSLQWDPAKLKNADVNIWAYWDDSSAKNYNNPELRWGQNQKYTWPETKNTEIAYDKNATVAWLDPNYLYGKEAQMKNSEEEWYIMRRNDNIASALYNEGKTSKQDVSDFLYGQKWFTNSEENERLNTIDSVYKRLGKIGEENPKQEEKQPEQTNTQQNNPEMKLDDDGTKTSTLYGKVTADKWTPVNWIKWEADPNAIQATINAARENNFKSLQRMDSYDIAVSMSAWIDPYGSQAMADLATYDPMKYKEIQDNLKNIQTMQDVNNISQGNGVEKVNQTEEQTNTINNSIDSWTKNNSTDRSYSDTLGILTDKLSSSQTASTATQEMLNINKDMAEIQEKMNNLPNEARKYFKGDVPQYIVDAYVSNRTAQYQSELNKLQSRYNSAVDLYKTEVAQKQWDVEMQLKQQQLNADYNQQLWDRTYKNRQLAMQMDQNDWNKKYQQLKLSFDNIKNINWTDYYMDANGQWKELNSEIAYQIYKWDVDEKLQNYLNIYPDWADGGQCEQWTDNFTEATTGLRMEWANGWATTAKEKASYVNSWYPTVGSVAVFDYWIKDENGVDWWHTMLVTWYDPTTWIVSLKWSNKSRKDWEYCKVYSQETTLANLQASASWQWFWDPYQDLQNQWLTLEWQNVSLYSKSNTPMTKTVDTLLKNASTAGERETVAGAEFLYDKLYALKKEEYLDKLIESNVIEDFINSIDRSKFGKQDDERGSEFLNQLWKYMRNKVKDEDVYYALNELYQMVERKLRKESGAAISSSEWLMDFQLFLPEAWQTAKAREDKLKAWDDIIYRDFRTAGMDSKDYIPIFYSTTQERKTW